MKRNIAKQEYAIFLRWLLYIIDDIDWRSNRSIHITKLLYHFEKRNSNWSKDVEEERKQVESAINKFKKEEISETDLRGKIVEIMKSLE